MAALGYQVSQADNDFVRKIVWSSASSSTYLPYSIFGIIVVD
jgi:hypothetical protein